LTGLTSCGKRGGTISITNRSEEPLSVTIEYLVTTEIVAGPRDIAAGHTENFDVSESGSYSIRYSGANHNYFIEITVYNGETVPVSIPRGQPW